MSYNNGINSPSCPEKTSKFTFKARDTDSLAARVEEKRALFERDHGVLPRALLTYEAGFEGFWPARVFHGRHGYEIVICDPASLEVSRRKKQVKTDRIDADRMIRALKLWDDGDMDALSHVRVPTLEQEDNRQLLRERERLVGMRVGLSNSILGLLRLQGVYGLHPCSASLLRTSHGRRRRWGQHFCPDWRRRLRDGMTCCAR